ncbi:uncharacterized protein LOC118279900 [Spodoptera frugiperda]|uniref:Uncharacterized protein LOC118279900 n=1 Tax=Spodoptera frugiperda TaxID=7108 RepID=A0A9R0ETA6_SPOFR|nr:uncharacterized protein LOC118279900 [Spodoptera frugiperda]
MSALNTFTLHMTFFLISECYFTTAMSTTAVTEASETKTRGSSFYNNIMNALLPSAKVKSAGNIDKSRHKREGLHGISPSTVIRFFLKLCIYLFGQFEDIDPHPMSKLNAEPDLINMEESYFPYMYEKDADMNRNQIYHGK